ncbi:C39 family peptidase [Nonomuraea sp. NPDC050310]|uniref:C39 family peptidase n=1 Tax=Nonomuraea sp. NPDC050310 TaxID=3154935 RepID=UPI0033E77727
MRTMLAVWLLMMPQPPVARAVQQSEEIVSPGVFVRRGEREEAVWTGPERRLPFAADEIVPSWTADTPPGTRLRVELKVPGSRWYVLGRWSYHGPRTTVAGQSDAHGRVRADVFSARRPVTSYRLRVTLSRPYGSAVQPVVRTLGAVASARGVASAERGGQAWGRELAVPRKSQLAHAGHGGRGWCSPTATAMVLHYWRKGPPPAELAWVAAGDPDPRVDHAARHTYDRGYRGTGNWAFNTAYAGRFGLDARVERFTSLAALERLIVQGVPPVVSLAFSRDELGYGSEGHLMVVTGFTRNGKVIVNDPAASGVRAVYPRAAFERAWLRASTGTTYVIRP